MDAFARNLRARQKQLGITQVEVARRAGIPESRYSNYARGKREPDLRSVVWIARALDVSTDQLFGTEPLPPDPGGEAPREAWLEELRIAARRLGDEELRLAVRLVHAMRDPAERPTD
jgi:transcriptional regulator with XRE-family HTH domain